MANIKTLKVFIFVAICAKILFISSALLLLLLFQIRCDTSTLLALPLGIGALRRLEIKIVA